MARRSFLSAILFLTVIFSFALCAEDSATSFAKTPPPSWVKKCDFPIDPPVKSSQVTMQLLLIDIQHNWEEKTNFIHRAKKVLNKEGISQLGQLKIEFNPNYQKVIFHSLNIIRDGTCSDRLESSRVKVLQREESLDKNIYRGNLNLIYFLDDLRVGDILEYSYSIIGSQPIFDSHYSSLFYLQDDNIVEKRSYRLLINPTHKIAIRPFYTSIEPQIAELSPTLREYSFEVLGGESIPSDKNMPAWYNPCPRVQISEYLSWKDVIEKEKLLYSLPKDLFEKTPPEMMELVNKWKKTTKDPMARATLALRFVQDEVRYLGFDEDGNGLYPTDPKTAFQRRFGDCKDKTMLLHALLKLMDIPSTPVLVNMKAGKRLPESLPLPTAFDHVILQIEIGKSSYFVDTTISFQGGTLKENYLPNYQWGLPVSPKATSLIPLPKPTQTMIEEITSTFIFKESDFAELTIKTQFYGRRADSIRESLDRQGIKGVSENFENYLHKKYKGATLTSPITFSDDREANIISSEECYQIPTQESASGKSIKIHSYVIEDSLHDDIKPSRTLPYALSYPFSVKEHIHVENHFNTWTPDIDTLCVEDASLQYSHHLKTDAHTLDFSYELKHLQDHVEADHLQDYRKIINQIEPKGEVEITIKNNAAKGTP